MNEFHPHNSRHLRSMCILYPIYFILLCVTVIFLYFECPDLFLNTGGFIPMIVVLLIIVPVFKLKYSISEIKDNHKEDIRKSIHLCNQVFYNSNYHYQNLEKALLNASLDFGEYFNGYIPKWYQMGLYDYTKEQIDKFKKENFLDKFYKLYPNATDYYCYETYKISYSDYLKDDSFLHTKHDPIKYNDYRRLERFYRVRSLYNCMDYFRFEDLVRRCNNPGVFKSRCLTYLTNLMKEREELCLYFKEIKEKYKILFATRQCIFCKFDSDDQAKILALKDNEFYDYNKFIGDLHLELPNSIQSLKDLKFDLDKIYSPLLITLAQYEKEYSEQQATYLSIAENYPFGASKYRLEHTNSEGDIIFVNGWNKEIENNEKEKKSIIRSYIAKDEQAYRKRKEDERRANEEAQRQKAIEEQKKKEKEERLKREFDKAKDLYSQQLSIYTANSGKSLLALISEAGFKGLQTLQNIPYDFLCYYYPSNRQFSPRHAMRTSQLIYDFKDGVSHEAVQEIVVNLLKRKFEQISKDISPKYIKPKEPYISTENKLIIPEKEYVPTSDIAKNFLFVCIPASSQEKYVRRCKNFSADLCKALGVEDGFADSQGGPNLVVGATKTPQHQGGDASEERIFYNEAAFRGKHVILFDDIVTTGNTMRKWIDRLQSLGATVDLIISIGYTYKDSFGSVTDPFLYSEKSRDNAYEAFQEKYSNSIVSGEVVGHDTDRGERSLQIKLNRKDGGYVFVNLSKLSKLREGDRIDIESICMVTLGVEGEDDIYRYDADRL